jgi:hypothetical protein
MSPTQVVAEGSPALSALSDLARSQEERRARMLMHSFLTAAAGGATKRFQAASWRLVLAVALCHVLLLCLSGLWVVHAVAVTSLPAVAGRALSLAQFWQLECRERARNWLFCLLAAALQCATAAVFHVLRALSRCTLLPSRCSSVGNLAAALLANTLQFLLFPRPPRSCSSCPPPARFPAEPRSALCALSAVNAAVSCRLPGRLLKLASVDVLSGGAALKSSLPGLNLVLHALADALGAIEGMFEAARTLPMPLVTARLMYAAATALLGMLPWTGMCAFGASEAFALCIRDSKHCILRVGNPGSAVEEAQPPPDSHGRGVPAQAELLAELASRQTAAGEIVLVVTLAALVPLWLLLLPAGLAAAALLTLLFVLSAFALFRCQLSSPLESPGARNVDTQGLLSALVASASARLGMLPYVLLLYLLAPLAFFGSGHFYEFSGIHWPAAFVGFEDSEPAWRSALLISINTFAQQAAAGVLLGLLACQACAAPVLFGEPRQLCWYDLTAMSRAHLRRAGGRDAPAGGRDAPAGGARSSTCLPPACHADSPQLTAFARRCSFFTALTALLLASSVMLLSASAGAFLQRRHLMIWALFAPRWLFECSMWLVTSVTVIAVSWVLERSFPCL